MAANKKISALSAAPEALSGTELVPIVQDGVTVRTTTQAFADLVAGGGGIGSVTSVAASVPDFLSISGSPITTSGTLAISYSGTALPEANGGTGLTALGTGVQTWLGTPSSANLAAAITDETGSGSLVFASAPTLSNPVVGTQSPGDNSTKAASTAYVDAAIAGSGAGSVSSFSFTDANGVDGTVTNATTTPTLSISLGAITPTSVAASGAVSGSNLSGTNTGDQTITLTGDVTGSGTGSFAATLATVNANVGSFGSATQTTTFTVNGKGLLTAAGQVTVTPAVGSITGLGTGIATALAVNVGSAGAPVLFNGAGGTPSSLTLTNATGLPVAGGGTGSSTAAGARTNLGIVIGTDVQAYDADLSTIAGLTATTDSFMQAKAGAWAARTVAQVSTDLQATGLVTDAVGFRTIPQNSQSTAYTTVAADSGKHLLHPSADTTARTFTIDSNANVAYPVGTAITFVNQASAGVLTIAITSDTMRLAGAGTTGSRTLAANGIATALKVTSTEWIISGTGLT